MSNEAKTTGADDRLGVIAEVVRHMTTSAFATDAGQTTGRPRILVANDAVMELTGYSFEQMEGRSPLMFAEDTTDQPQVTEARASLAAGRAHRARTLQKRPDGSLYWVDWAMSPIHDESGQVELFFWLQVDVSSEVKAEQMRDILFEALNLSDDSVIISSDTEIEFVNLGFQRLSGLSLDEVIGQPAEFLGVEALDWRTLEPLEAPTMAPRHLVRATGSRDENLYLDVATTAVADQVTGAVRYVHVGKDVTEEIRRRTDEHARAQRDSLTGLYNRRGGEAMLDEARAEAQVGGSTFSVVMCDLDRFKLVNDTHGHAVGDRVLIGLSGVLSDNVRAGDSVIRWGGEEFLLVLPGAAGDVAVELAERLRELVAAEETETAGRVTVSMGVAEWNPDDGLASMVSRADTALYASKAAGRNRTTLAEHPSPTR